MGLNRKSDEDHKRQREAVDRLEEVCQEVMAVIVVEEVGEVDEEAPMG